MRRVARQGSHRLLRRTESDVAAARCGENEIGLRHGVLRLADLGIPADERPGRLRVVLGCGPEQQKKQNDS